MVHLNVLSLRVIQELLEDVDALAIQICVEGLSHLVMRLLCLPLVLPYQHLVMLSIQSEEFLLVVVSHLTHVNIGSFS